MRALAGPAMLLVMVGGFVLHRALSEDVVPSRDFTELEFAGADHTGSCYSLSTVLIANRAPGDAARTWISPRDDEWTLTIEDVVQAYGGPARVFQRFTFERRGEHVHLVSVDASKDIPTGLARNIDALLEAPNMLNSTPVDRCQQPGATGYLFTPRR
jgi:hypothetical protein